MGNGRGCERGEQIMMCCREVERRWEMGGEQIIMCCREVERRWEMGGDEMEVSR